MGASAKLISSSPALTREIVCGDTFVALIFIIRYFLAAIWSIACSCAIITSPVSQIKDLERVPRTLKLTIWRFRACGFAALCFRKGNHVIITSPANQIKDLERTLRKSPRLGAVRVLNTGSQTRKGL